jgi:polysaccharide pyruvyl transferase WcaK-like protein
VGFDPVYFCQNTSNDVQCISYAASMGIININQQERNTLTQYLTAFDTILVRENSLKELINSLAIEAEVVVDPTLLLTKEQWNELLPSTRYRKHKYVLYYELIKSPEAMAFAIKQAKALNCKLLVMDSSIRTIPRKNHIAFASPIEFMHAIRDEEYIVATSFHGTAFSIIFEKQFITIGLNKNSDRVQTLLRHLDIEEHYQHHPTNVSAIKYDETSTVLHKIKTQSKQLLLAALTKN